jgi:hypothetical protein
LAPHIPGATFDQDFREPVNERVVAVAIGVSDEIRERFLLEILRIARVGDRCAFEQLTGGEGSRSTDLLLDVRVAYIRVAGAVAARQRLESLFR